MRGRGGVVSTGPDRICSFCIRLAPPASRLPRLPRLPVAVFSRAPFRLLPPVCLQLLEHRLLLLAASSRFILPWPSDRTQPTVGSASLVPCSLHARGWFCWRPFCVSVMTTWTARRRLRKTTSASSSHGGCSVFSWICFLLCASSSTFHHREAGLLWPLLAWDSNRLLVGRSLRSGVRTPMHR